MMTLNTDRKKHLQISILRAVQSMRSIFCRTLRQKVVLLAALQSPCLGHGPSKPSGMPFKPRRESSRTEGPNPVLRPSNRLICTPMSGRPYLS